MSEHTISAPHQRASSPNDIGRQEEHLALLALNRISGLGPTKQSALLNHFGSAVELFAQSYEALVSEGVPAPIAKSVRAAPWADAEQDLRWSERYSRAVVFPTEPGYPELLGNIADPPPALFVVGQLAAVKSRSIAIVGSRRATPGGLALARDLAEQLAIAGWTIVSGLALGIDGASHRGALRGGGQTVGVLGSGPDLIYPSKHRDLAVEMLSAGAIVSEFPPGTLVHPGHFPRRNRVVSGLARAVIVVEASQRSGSLITARLALEQGREVMAVPGSPASKFSSGTNGLLRDGALLVRDAGDVLAELEPSSHLNGTGQKRSKSLPPLDDSGEQIVAALAHGPVGVDELVRLTGLSAADTQAQLGKLDLQGYVSRLADGTWGAV